MGKTYHWKKYVTFWTISQKDLRTILLCLVAYWWKHLRSLAGICDGIVPMTVLLIQEARKLPLGQQIVIFVPHAAASMLEQQRHHFLSLSRMVQYQAALLEQYVVSLKTTSLNPATLLPVPNDEKTGVLEYCDEVPPELSVVQGQKTYLFQSCSEDRFSSALVQLHIYTRVVVATG